MVAFGTSCGPPSSFVLSVCLLTAELAYSGMRGLSPWRSCGSSASMFLPYSELLVVRKIGSVRGLSSAAIWLGVTYVCVPSEYTRATFMVCDRWAPSLIAWSVVLRPSVCAMCWVGANVADLSRHTGPPVCRACARALATSSMKLPYVPPVVFRLLKTPVLYAVFAMANRRLAHNTGRHYSER